MADNRQSLLLAQDQIDELRECFQTLDEDGNGFIEFDELRYALEKVGIKKAPYEIRLLIDQKFQQSDLNKDGKLSLEEFQNLYYMLKSQELSSSFKKQVKRAENVKAYGGMTEGSVEGTTHTVRDHEQLAFTQWINSNLQGDPDCSKYLPLSVDNSDIYTKISDGVLLCKVINIAVPHTIDERAVNKTNLNVYRSHENLVLGLNSARAIGCNIVNIGAEDLEHGKPHLVLGLLWQIIRIGLLSDINLAANPNLAVLLREGEDISELKKLSPEQLLLRWVNYHLERAGIDKRIENFTTDIRDSEAYTHLLHQISPKDPEHEMVQTYGHITLAPLGAGDAESRAEAMLCEAAKIECRAFVMPQDVVAGNYKLNLAFVANLFNKFPALDDSDAVDFEAFEETREEKTYRNWMNSMGVSPYVHYLYNDLSGGLIIFQLYDIIKAGSVDWSRVKKKFSPLRKVFQMIENCNYAVELGKDFHFSLVGIGGQDIYDGNTTLTLALVWQLMRAYTLSILTRLNDTGHPVAEKEIVVWANEKLKSSGKKSQLTSFNDSTLSNSRTIIDLIDAVKPSSINYDLVKPGNDDDEKMANAQYAVSMGRKIGARIYALPEDIVEVKPKMVMTIFACLMIKDYQPPAVH